MKTIIIFKFTTVSIMCVNVTRCTTRTKGQQWSTKHYTENWRL